MSLDFVETNGFRDPIDQPDQLEDLDRFKVQSIADSLFRDIQDQDHVVTETFPDSATLAARTPGQKAPYISVSVYCAKEPFPDAWNSPYARMLVTQAREEGFVQKYGAKRFDEFDDGSAIYLAWVNEVLAEDPDSQTRDRRIEAFSLRIVPAAIKGTEDLFFYAGIKNGRKYPIDQLMAMKLALEDGDPDSDNPNESYLDAVSAYTATLSRWCSIKPFRLKYAQNVDTDGVTVDIQRERINRHDGIAFALINQKIIKDIPRLFELPIKYLTAQIHEGLRSRVFSWPPMSGKITLPWTPAREFLNLTDPNAVAIDRNREGVYANGIPQYFLNKQVLQRRLYYWVDQGRLNLQTPGVVVASANPEQAKEGWADRSKLLTTIGLIHGTTMTGEELRSDLDRTVPDAVALYINDIDEWEDGVDKLIYAAKDPNQQPRSARQLV